VPVADAGAFVVADRVEHEGRLPAADVLPLAGAEVRDLVGGGQLGVDLYLVVDDTVGEVAEGFVRRAVGVDVRAAIPARVSA
jgi:hypothetical protein